MPLERASIFLTYAEGVVSYTIITTDSQVLQGYKALEEDNPMSGFVIDGYHTISIDWNDVDVWIQDKKDGWRKAYEFSEENNPLHGLIKLEVQEHFLQMRGTLQNFIPSVLIEESKLKLLSKERILLQHFHTFLKLN